MPDKSPDFAAFISYAKADDKKAHKIAELLESRGFKCWIAPRDVRPGAAYGAEIMRGIETSGAFILVLSSASNQSDFVAREVERAISMKKAVLPIRIENVEPSRSLQLFISANQWIDAFSGRFATHIDRLASRLAEQDTGAPVHPGVVQPDPKSPSPSRWAWRTGAVVAAAIAALVLVFAWPSNRQHAGPTPVTDPSVISDPVTLQETPPQVADRPADLPSIDIAVVPHDTTSGSTPAAADQMARPPESFSPEGGMATAKPPASGDFDHYSPKSD